MSDPSSAPIVVDATPTRAQLTAGVRQVLLAASAVTTAFGFMHLGQQLTAASLVATEIATGISGLVTVGAFVLGQIHTRETAKKLTITAAASPDDVAQVKQP